MIYTSYFGKYKKSNGYSIALFRPNWFTGYSIISLAPTYEIFKFWKGSLQDEKAQKIYEKMYYEQVLSKLNVHDLAKCLQDKVLLCYEKPGNFCHRHLVAKWFNENGYECEELTFDKKE